MAEKHSTCERTAFEDERLRPMKYIAIDDTYSQTKVKTSSYITGDRRSHVAVIFNSEEAKEVRSQLAGCLDCINEKFGINATEFHFADIYNKNKSWSSLPNEANLMIFDFFFKIYQSYRWPIIIQTIDHHTFSDHKLNMSGKLSFFDLSKKEHLSLLWILFKIKNNFSDNPEDLNIIIDEGIRKAGTELPKVFFNNYNANVKCFFSASTDPLLQIADFIAYSINKSTNIAIKSKKSEIDMLFLDMFSAANFNSQDLLLRELPRDFTIEDIDRIIKEDKINKGLLKPQQGKAT